MVHFFIRGGGPAPVSYYDSNFRHLSQVIRFSGYPRAALQKIVLDICGRAEAEQTPVELIHHSLDNSLQGVILPELSAGMIGFDAWDPQEPNVLAAFDSRILTSLHENIRSAQDCFARARGFHNDQEKIYIANMNFDTADTITQNTIGLLYQQEEGKGPGKEIHRFFGAATPVGNIDYIPQVTGDIPRRYFVKGRSGTGKSTFLKRIAAAAVERGYTVETYHCALDPNSLDLVAVREKGFCLLDSTAPHEYFPSREGDEIIDFYQLCVTPGTDEKYAQELQMMQGSYKALVKEACTFLGQAKKDADAFDGSLPKITPTALEEITRATLKRLF